MGYMNSEKEMLEQMKNDLDKLNDMLKKSEGKNYYSKEKAKVICKIIAPFVGFTGIFSSLYILTIGVPFMKHNTKAYLNKETTTYDDNTKSVYEYYVNKENGNIDSDYDYSELYLKDALELADLIFKTNQDKIDFLKQYVKSINDINYSYDLDSLNKNHLIVMTKK